MLFMHKRKQRKGQIMNGWTNSETHSFYNWLMNDEILYDYTMRLTQDAGREADPARYLSDKLKETIQNESWEVLGICGELLKIAIDRINFNEIAESLLSE